MRISTFNVNGIRAADRRGFREWLADRDCDVVALQEVRCREDDLPNGVFGDYAVTYDPGQLAGRNGVALLTRQPPSAIRLGVGLPEFAGEGRYVEVDLAEVPLTVASLYLPKGATVEVDEEKYQRKMRFLSGFSCYLTKARRAAQASGREFLVLGDFNIAHTKADLKNWRSNQKSEGFLPEERAWFDSILSPRTLVDVVRHRHPDVLGPHSWWSWRGQAFTNDAGWRIDYHLATPGLANRAVSAAVDREASYDERLSDHAPVVVDYDFTPEAPEPKPRE